MAVLPGYSSGSIPWVRSIPASLEASFATEIEPFIDSCDGIANTRGWSQVVVEVAFKWHGSVPGLFALLTPRLARLGWTPDPPQEWNPPQQAWHKELANGTMASVQVMAPEGPPYPWFFTVTAPPVGKAVDGC